MLKHSFLFNDARTLFSRTLFLCLLLTVSACSTQHKHTPSPHLASQQWQLQQAARAALASWSLTARISIRNNESRNIPLTLEIIWQHKNNTSTIKATELFSRKTYTLTITDNYSSVQNATSKIISQATSFTELSNTIINQPISYATLIDAITARKHHSYITYPHIAPINDLLLPKKIIITKPPHTITVAILQWRIPQ